MTRVAHWRKLEKASEGSRHVEPFLQVYGLGRGNKEGGREESIRLTSRNSRAKGKRTRDRATIRSRASKSRKTKKESERHSRKEAGKVSAYESFSIIKRSGRGEGGYP